MTARLPRAAAASLFLERQGLARPGAVPFTRASLERLVEDAGGVQLDSINVVARAHLLTLWSRFGPYDPARLERWVYRDRALVEYWAHAACLVPRAHLPAWRRAMLDYRTRDTGWAGWLKRHGATVRKVEETVRARGPVGGEAFERHKKGGGWWEWKPAAHALHFLWMSGRIAVHSREHFKKRYDLAERVLPEAAPMTAAEFRRWHVLASLRAMGAATEADLAGYMTFPRLTRTERREVLKGFLKEGRVVEVALEGHTAPWYARAEDLPELERAAHGRIASQGTTFLSPFDSLLWHRARAAALFGFDYRIEVYTPAPKRVYGYYVLPVLHDGRLVGRLDPKLHRAERRLEARALHLEPGVEADDVLPGVAGALRSLAAFLGASDVSVPRQGHGTGLARLL